MSLDEQLAQLGTMVDGWTRAALAESISPQAERLGAVLEYHLGWRDEHLQPLHKAAPAGKKLRPALVLLVCQAICGEINAAAAAFGGTAGMRVGEALARCPRLGLVTADPGAVADASEAMLTRLEDMGAAVEPLAPGSPLGEAPGGVVVIPVAPRALPRPHQAAAKTARQARARGWGVGGRVPRDHADEAHLAPLALVEVMLDRICRIDDGGHPGVLVAHDVRSAPEVVIDELLEEHERDASNGCGYIS